MPNAYHVKVTRDLKSEELRKWERKRDERSGGKVSLIEITFIE